MLQLVDDSYPCDHCKKWKHQVLRIKSSLGQAMGEHDHTLHLCAECVSLAREMICGPLPQPAPWKAMVGRS